MIKQLLAPTLSIFESHNLLAHLSDNDQYLFRKFGFGPKEQPSFDSIPLAFEYYAQTQPEAIAIKYQHESLTYQQLNFFANQLARFLLSQGVSRGDRIGLFIRRSPNMVISILACLKIGAAYVPQDVAISPSATIQFITEKANISLILSEQKYLPYLQHIDKEKLIFIDHCNLSDYSEQNLPPLINYDEIICFILFTSGTTGNPNGVKVTQKNLCNILLTSPGNMGIKPGDKVSHILNIAFDMAAWEILGCLCNGATLLIRAKDFQETVNQANVVIATPSILAKLNPETCENLKRVFVAGEPCPLSLALQWSKFSQFNNCCGPTETTIINTLKTFTPTEALTIGKPTPNNTVYILDSDLKPCAIGETGEMWAGGNCVTQGYLDNDLLTQERYRPDPFMGEGFFMFKTRDLGRWTDKGELEHLGRCDDQVKIKGFRIELDSISNLIENHPSCTNAITLKFNNDTLVAFVTPASADVNSINILLNSKLPYYSIPKRIFILDSFPVTDRGKANKRELLKLAIQTFSAEQVI